MAMLIGVFSHHGQRSVDVAPVVATHELGHALGYWGHSPNPNDVMRPRVGNSLGANLRPAEIEHILQVYRRFRRCTSNCTC